MICGQMPVAERALCDLGLSVLAVTVNFSLIASVFKPDYHPIINYFYPNYLPTSTSYYEYVTACEFIEQQLIFTALPPLWADW